MFGLIFHMDLGVVFVWILHMAFKSGPTSSEVSFKPLQFCSHSLFAQAQG
jgi:hypothetical protein